MKNEIVFSFAASEVGPLSRAFIKLTELSTGQPKLKRIYDNYVKENRPPELFWHDAVERLNLKVSIHSKISQPIPNKGRLIVIANHPFGVADGITICSMVSKIRQDLRLMTHRVLSQAPAVSHQILPIDFSQNKKALINNIKTKHQAQNHLLNEGVVIIFPSGEISSTKKLKQKAVEPEWKTFVSKLALKYKTPILPLFFEGQNSNVFHIANKINQTLRYSVMMYELCKRMGKEINVHVGDLIEYETIKSIGDLKKISKFLRSETYKLDPDSKKYLS
ncbi:MAG: hypothetical protein CFH22_00694 [Alphaproteobacteria bacterium MarineAlpha5_Bin12]|nr:MAG: hypothetical protein CFH22_00694 [Alphaproteobacteria bacterium MarineAlpha5_Bin12]|tara:strand:- start:7 stop:837 length:831 start_codon:yes stop_codon:yes gene_type:complete